MTGEVEQRPLADLHPSQLLVSAEKLRGVLDWWDADDPEPKPLPYLKPVEDVGLSPEHVESGRIVLADGHTRALAAVLSGAETVTVARDLDRENLSMNIYRECVGWCIDEEVRRPADLVGRVVSDDRFRTDWVERCQAVAES